MQFLETSFLNTESDVEQYSKSHRSYRCVDTMIIL